MSIVACECDGSFDASETGYSTKCPWKVSSRNLTRSFVLLCELHHLERKPEKPNYQNVFSRSCSG